MKDILERASRIRLLIFDVDGVLTDGSLFLDNRGEEVVEHRMANLGITHIYQGKLEKLPAFEELINEVGVTAEQTAYVGDDVVDLPVMRRVGLAIAVQDAHPMVVRHSHWQTPTAGGRGAARDVCEMLMEAHGVLEQELERYL